MQRTGTLFIFGPAGGDLKCVSLFVENLLAFSCLRVCYCCHKHSPSFIVDRTSGEINRQDGIKLARTHQWALK